MSQNKTAHIANVSRTKMIMNNQIKQRKAKSLYKTNPNFVSKSKSEDSKYQNQAGRQKQNQNLNQYGSLDSINTLDSESSKNSQTITSRVKSKVRNFKQDLHNRAENKDLAKRELVFRPEDLLAGL